MSKTRDTGYLNNIIKTDANGNVTFVNGSTTLMSISSSGAVTTTGVISGSNALSASYAQTASYANAFTVANTLTAQTLVVQTITSSVIYSSGSNVFGNNIANTQTFTGSVLISGSIGIGTTPTNTLNVRGNNGTSTAAVVRLRDTNTTARTTRLQFEDYTGALADGLIDFRIGTAGNASTATLSIGINSAGLTFDNSNAATFASSITTGGGINLSGIQQLVLGYDQAGGAIINYASNGNLDITPRSGYSTIFKAGNVGIGTSSPSNKLVVSNGGANGFEFDAPNGTILTYNRSTSAYSTLNFNASEIVSYISGTERMRITSGGDVQVQGTNSSAKIILFRNYSNSQPGISVYNTGGTEILYFNGNTSSLGISGNISANNIKNIGITLQGTGTPVSTGLSINSGGGGRCYLLLTSQQWDAGNATGATVTMIRCGYNGNNFTAVVLGSSQPQVETWSQSGGILYVAGNLNYQLNITVLSNN